MRSMQSPIDIRIEKAIEDAREIKRQAEFAGVLKKDYEKQKRVIYTKNARAQQAACFHVAGMIHQNPPQNLTLKIGTPEADEFLWECILWSLRLAKGDLIKYMPDVAATEPNKRRREYLIAHIESFCKALSHYRPPKHLEPSDKYKYIRHAVVSVREKHDLTLEQAYSATAEAFDVTESVVHEAMRPPRIRNGSGQRKGASPRAVQR
jgi:hypothetical protein